MMRLVAAILIAFIWVVPVQAKDVTLSMLYSNAVGEELPFALFEKGKWTPAKNARFVKLHMYFDEPLAITELIVKTCGQQFNPKITVFVNFEQWMFDYDESEGGARASELVPEQISGDRLRLYAFKELLDVRSLTWNFEKNQNFSLCGIYLADENGDKINLKIPRIAEGTVVADSTLKPKEAYDVVNLFDSRFEYGWASDRKAKDVSLNFNFNKEQRIERIRIWNGYQRSVRHCYSNSRAKTIVLTGDNGYSETIHIQDELGSQAIWLTKAFVGTHLRMKIVDSYPGKNYKDLVISELRFYSGNEWFIMDPFPKMKKDIKRNRELFDKGHLKAILNDGYSGYETDPENTDFSKLRFRADGSFYLSGQGFDEDDGEMSFFALGNYEVKSVDPKKGVKLRIFGLYYENAMYGDCNGCGRDCNRNDPSYDGGIIFQEYIILKKTADNRIKLVNLSGGKKIKIKEQVYEREK